MRSLLAQAPEISPDVDSLPDGSSAIVEGVFVYLFAFVVVALLPVVVGSAVAWAVGRSKGNSDAKRWGKWVFIASFTVMTLFFIAAVVAANV